MSNQSARYIWAALAALAGLALIIAAVVLLTREDEPAPVRIVAPQPAEEPVASPVIKVQVSGRCCFQVFTGWKKGTGLSTR